MGLAVLLVNRPLIGLRQQEKDTEVLVGNLLRKAIEPCTVRCREKANRHSALLASNVPLTTRPLRVAVWAAREPMRLSVCRLSKQSLINSSRNHLDEKPDEGKERGDGTLDRLCSRQYGGTRSWSAACGIAERGVQRRRHFLRYRVGGADGTPRLGGLCPRLRAGRYAGGVASRPPRAVDDP